MAKKTAKRPAPKKAPTEIPARLRTGAGIDRALAKIHRAIENAEVWADKPDLAAAKKQIRAVEVEQRLIGKAMKALRKRGKGA